MAGLNHTFFKTENTHMRWKLHFIPPLPENPPEQANTTPYELLYSRNLCTLFVGDGFFIIVVGVVVFVAGGVVVVVVVGVVAV